MRATPPRPHRSPPRRQARRCRDHKGRDTRPQDEAAHQALLGFGLDEWFANALVGLYQDYRRSGTGGYAAQVTRTVERLTGRPARSLDDLLAEIAPTLQATHRGPAGA